MKYIALGGTALIFGLSAFAYKEHKASKGTLKSEADILLILGCRVRGNEAEPTLQMRIDRAAEYLKENKNTIAIACGGIVHKDQFRSEAQVISDKLLSKGIEKERVILEDKSRTTVENFINAKKIMADMGFDTKAKVAMLSSEFHLMRARVIAERCGLAVETLPAPSPKKEKIKNYVRELFAFPMAYTQTKGVK